MYVTPEALLGIAFKSFTLATATIRLAHRKFHFVKCWQSNSDVCITHMQLLLLMVFFVFSTHSTHLTTSLKLVIDLLFSWFLVKFLFLLIFYVYLHFFPAFDFIWIKILFISIYLYEFNSSESLFVVDVQCLYDVVLFDVFVKYQL